MNHTSTVNGTFDDAIALPLGAPTPEDLADYEAWLAATDAPSHATEPTPVEALGEPWWETAPYDPELDEVRYGIEPPEPFGGPVGVAIDAWMPPSGDPRRRTSNATDRDVYGHDLASRAADDRLIDRLGRCEYPD